MRHRRALNNRSTHHASRSRRPEHEPIYFLIGLFIVAAFGVFTVDHCHRKNMMTMTDCDARSARCQ